MINKILRNQRYRGPRETIKFNSDLAEIKTDLSINNATLEPVLQEKELLRINLEEEQENQPKKFQEVTIIDGNNFMWENLGNMKARISQIVNQLAFFRKMLKKI